MMQSNNITFAYTAQNIRGDICCLQYIRDYNFMEGSVM